MALSKEKIQTMVQNAGRALQAESDTFSDIDSRFGDGDHGVTMAKIGALMENADASGTLYEYFDDLGDAIMAVGGGSAGPLYGTLVGGMAAPLEGKTEADAATVKAMLAGSLAAMREITTAAVGDKTMMDALVPAVEAAQNTSGDEKAVLAAAASAAKAGAKASEGFVSKFGRAKSYGAQTIGTPDAGALSTACFIAGMAGAL